MTDEGGKAETGSKIIVYGVSMQVIVLTEPNNKNCLTHNMML
jgi:hypothetical protein